MPQIQPPFSGENNGNQAFLINARWLLTVNSDNDVYLEHSLIVEGGRIVNILPWKEANAAYPQLPVIDRRESILMPGLINAHTHLAMNLLKGFADDLPLQTWLEKHIWPVEAAHMSPEFVRDGTELALAESILAGVTMVNDMYFFADTTAQVCEMAGVKATIGLLVIDFPSAWAATTDEYFDKALQLHDDYRQHATIRTAFAPHAPYSVNTNSLQRIAALSDELQLPVHIHVQETLGEIERYQQTHGVRPVQALSDIGLVNPNLLAVHLTHVNASDIEQLATGGACAIHCPESNLKLASGVCPVMQLDKAGVTVATGTDGAASNNDLDLLGECKTAAFLAKVQSADAGAMPASRALRMITIDAAKALGVDHLTGSLEIGKAADCITIEPDLSMLPIYDPHSAILFSNAASRVQDVWVNGRQLLDKRKLQTLDSKSLETKARYWSQIIRSA